MHNAVRSTRRHVFQTTAQASRALSSSSLMSNGTKNPTVQSNSDSGLRQASGNVKNSSDGKNVSNIEDQPVQKPKKKTIAELDEEVKLKLEGISGEGGAAGLEYENGKAVAMKRGVKENMFRLI